MKRQLSAASALENFKKEAKRWLKALRAGDAEARERLERAYPGAPAEPGLRDLQRALALEHGLPGWSALIDRLGQRALEGKRRPGLRHSEDLAEQFLENACADPILANGPAAHANRSRAAMRVLERYPEIARASIHTAVVCGDLEEVRRILKERPGAATEPGGPLRKRALREREKLWTPLLHLCYGRLPTPAAAGDAVEIARLLLDHGADPNDYFEVGSHPCRYTALCGAAGEGEDDAPPHPRRDELARLLLERGAEPYDIQLFYNTHFRGDILWMMKLVYEASVRAGRQADWEDPDWSMVDMGGLNLGARYFLGTAVERNDLALAEWLLAHGANPDASPSPKSNLPARPLHEEAMRRGFTEMADLLERFGATPVAPAARSEDDAFTAACFRLDREGADAILARRPELLRSPNAIFEAARQDRAEVVEFLLDLGVPIEVEDEYKQRPLHEAASHDSLRVAKLLLDRGAEADPVETNWGATPLSFAIYGQKTRMIELLGRFSHDVWCLTQSGRVERLRELLAVEPGLAKVAGENSTPLMWLPDDEARAIEVAELLLAHGADPNVKDKEGQTAADRAEGRGLYEVAGLLRSK
jgi:ankyrin repeat protein